MYAQRAITRSTLLEIIRENFPKANLVSTALRLERLIKEVESLKDSDGMVYNKSGRLVKSVLVGEKWKDQKRQWRRMRREFPLAPKHRPKRMWPRYYVAKLGEEYLRQTGRLPKRGLAGGLLSPFERFVDAMIRPLDVKDIQGLVREYLQEKTTQSPWAGSSMT